MDVGIDQAAVQPGEERRASERNQATVRGDEAGGVGRRGREVEDLVDRARRRVRREGEGNRYRCVTALRGAAVQMSEARGTSQVAEGEDDAERITVS